MSLRTFFSSPSTTTEQAQLVRDKKALLVDIREADEWCSGVAKGAVLLPLSDLNGARELWAPFLAQRGDRQLLLYCASGARSAYAAKILSAEGFPAADAGSIRNWDRAGWPVCKPRGCDR